MDYKKNMDLFITNCVEQKALSTKTTQAYYIDLKQYLTFSNGLFDKEELRKYIAFLHKNFKPKTAKRKIATLKAFTHYLLIEEIIENNPFDKIETSFREPLILPRTIPFNIICNIIKEAYQEIDAADTFYKKKCAIRDAAILEILFATGARVSEICSLSPNAVDLKNHSIRILGKGSKERIIQIENSDVLTALLRYYNTFFEDIQSSGFFFVNKLKQKLSEQSVRAIINNHVTAINCKKHITPHMFRHSFATLLLEENVDIRYIQKILGHSSITTTQIYTHVAMAKQKEILTLKHPRNRMFI